MGQRGQEETEIRWESLRQAEFNEVVASDRIGARETELHTGCAACHPHRRLPPPRYPSRRISGPQQEVFQAVVVLTPSFQRGVLVVGLSSAAFRCSPQIVFELASAHPSVVFLCRVIADEGSPCTAMDYWKDGGLFIQIPHQRRYPGQGQLVNTSSRNRSMRSNDETCAIEASVRLSYFLTSLSPSQEPGFDRPAPLHRLHRHSTRFLSYLSILALGSLLNA